MIVFCASIPERGRTECPLRTGPSRPAPSLNEGGAAMSETKNGRSPRSVALVGPSSSGKSTLFEALLDAAGAPVKRPADPRNRPMTTEIRLGHCSYLGDPWSILDCPGSIEFAHQTCSALAMVDIAVVVCEPTPAKAAMAAPLLKTLRDEGVTHI